MKSGEASVGGNIGGSILKFAKAEGSIAVQGGIGQEINSYRASKEVVEKTLHDAAFDIAYKYVSPIQVTERSSSNYGDYIHLTRIFDIVDLDYLENLFTKGSLIGLIKKSEKEKIESTANEVLATTSRKQLRTQGNNIKNTIRKAVEESHKQYDNIKEIIDAFRQLIPYDKMLISYDGYLIPMDDKYFRIDSKSLGFKYGGEITCVGVVTNIIGEDTNPCDSNNIFATLQFAVNEMLRSILPTKESNLCVIHPIAIYYNN